MTKQEALRDLKALAEAVDVLSTNQQTNRWPVSPFVFQNWMMRLKKIVKTLEATSGDNP
jgi:hypothetical protein